MKRERLMSRAILLRCYKRLRGNPLKTFVLRDFGLNSQLDRVYLLTLVTLGIAEEVEVYYKMGSHSQGTKNTKGYRLSKQEREKIINEIKMSGRNWIEQEELNIIPNE
jgi:hypothetical protein